MAMRMMPPSIAALLESLVPNFFPITRPERQMIRVTVAMIRGTDKSHEPVILCDGEADGKSVDGSGDTLDEKGPGGQPGVGNLFLIFVTDTVEQHASADIGPAGSGRSRE